MSLESASRSANVGEAASRAISGCVLELEMRTSGDSSGTSTDGG